VSSGQSQAIRKRRIRQVRDSENRIVEIREFSEKAQVGDVCYALKIQRDTTTKMIKSFYSVYDKVIQADLDIVT